LTLVNFFRNASSYAWRINQSKGDVMSTRWAEYKGFTIKARAFEIGETGRFMASLHVSSAPGGVFINLPVTHGLRGSADEALQCAVEDAKWLIETVGDVG
jgi:hypothetical protein